MKKFLPPSNINFLCVCVCVNINMINLSLDELRLIAQNRDYENKSEKGLIKGLSEPKPKINIDKKKLEKIRKDFNELRHKFSKKEIDKYRKAFYDIKNYAYKLRYNKKCKNHVILLMINDGAKDVLFCCKNLVRIIFYGIVKK